MSFILRAAFWLTVLAFLLPTGGNQATAQNNLKGGAIPATYATSAPVDDVDAGEMLSLAAKSAGDVMGFCSRNPEVCSRGSAIVSHVAHQGSYYGSKAFLWLTEKAREAQEAGPTPEPASSDTRSSSKPSLTGA
jgi:hypothetical protein